MSSSSIAIQHYPELRCNDYPTVQNGKARHAEGRIPPFDVGTHLAILCNQGYVFSGRGIQSFTCEKLNAATTAVWNPVSAACVPKSCGAPPWIEHGWTKGKEYKFGDEVVYECDPGRVLTGPKSYWCGPSGEWIPESINSLRCVPILCPEPEKWKEENGTLKINSGPNVVGKQAEYVCEPGYRIVDSRIKTVRSTVRTCGLNGTWSGDIPRCEKVSCPEVPAYLAAVGGSENNSSRDEGSVIVIRCKNGKEHVIQCKMDGAWTGRWPLCPEDKEEVPPTATTTTETTITEEDHTFRPTEDSGKKVPIGTDTNDKEKHNGFKKRKSIDENISYLWPLIAFIAWIIFLIFVHLVSSKEQRFAS